MPDLRRVIATLIPGAVLLALAVGAPGASAQTTGASGGASPTDPDVTTVPDAQTAPLLPAPVDLGGRIGAVLGMQATLSGSLPGAAGRTVAIQRQDPKASWLTVALATAGPDGAFSAPWTVDRVGLFAMRAVLTGPAAVQAAAVSAPLTPVTGYRPGKATFFGPGLYGRRTACGQRLTRRLRGIAHRTLPCGTVVEVVYHGKVLRAPVVDRGPFTRGIRYDLTQATAKDLGFRQTDTVGAAQVAAAPQSSR